MYWVRKKKQGLLFGILQVSSHVSIGVYSHLSLFYSPQNKESRPKNTSRQYNIIRILIVTDRISLDIYIIFSHFAALSKFDIIIHFANFSLEMISYFG